jgi:hypothetical protein
MADDLSNENIEMDSTGLYRDESITDRQVGSLQRLIPIRADGSDDPDRSVIYMGQTQILTPAGALPLNFEIEAASLQEAVSNFGDHAKVALAETMQRIEAMRREQASSLIVPGSGAGPGRGIQIP